MTHLNNYATPLLLLNIQPMIRLLTPTPIEEFVRTTNDDPESRLFLPTGE